MTFTVSKDEHPLNPGESWVFSPTTQDSKEPSKIVLHPRKFGADALRVAACSAGIENVWMLDSQYRVLPKDEMLECVKAVHTDSEQYISEFHDCDQFARELWSRVPWMTKCNSVGLVLNFGGEHAFNCVFVTPDTTTKSIQCLIVEPQSDGIVQLGSSHPYTLEPSKYQVIV